MFHLCSDLKCPNGANNSLFGANKNDLGVYNSETSSHSSKIGIAF